ncbi:MAG: biofilm regulation phosphoprotein SiaC [Tepidiphilus sp.]|uniref:biofilm regulation phosphoprotein SiaC n=1 Tax=Tepidiphilus TaxID=203470 RepID=UPI00115CE75F|nr:MULTISPECIES: biofilm regulation phosphoprotein SiaC [Tepidiphilus]MDD2408547.1 biofilm regulation phosphoprotein SiaC [Tepidiphilus sp.]MDD3433725.1 biofilm regulation phosphoprotein SiaC [Tepidiphilus sp.]
MSTSFTLPGTQTTPTIVADWNEGLLQMSGDSYPENSFDFFTGTLDWVESFLKRERRPLRLELRLLYMNTSSVKVMMDIFDLLEDAHKLGQEVSVVWRFDPRNERVELLAEEFREDCTFPFHICAEV